MFNLSMQAGRKIRTGRQRKYKLMRKRTFFQTESRRAEPLGTPNRRGAKAPLMPRINPFPPPEAGGSTTPVKNRRRGWRDFRRTYWNSLGPDLHPEQETLQSGFGCKSRETCATEHWTDQCIVRDQTGKAETAGFAGTAPAE